MNDTEAPEKSDVIVIGAGQCGLAVARALRAAIGDTVILEARPTIGAQWRDRWNSLRLFTPARHDGLPGMPFPAPPASYPTGHDFADYLEAYAARFAISVQCGIRVNLVRAVDDGFVLETSAGRRRARSVVIATGANTTPYVPSFSDALDPNIQQLHSSSYREPSQVVPGDVLVVGAGTSGVQIALELAATQHVTIAGRPTVHIPDLAFRVAGEAYWAFIHRVLTVRTPVGRRVARQYHHRGNPLIGVSMADVASAGIQRRSRVVGVSGGQPLTEDGKGTRVDAIIWATGYRPDYRWIEALPLTSAGWPDVDRGVVPQLPGLFFVGLPFQHGLTSELIGGAGRDATHVAERVRECLDQVKAM